MTAPGRRLTIYGIWHMVTCAAGHAHGQPSRGGGSDADGVGAQSERARITLRALQREAAALGLPGDVARQRETRSFMCSRNCHS